MNRVILLLSGLMGVLGSLAVAQPEFFVVELYYPEIKGLYILKVPDVSQPPPLSRYFECLGIRRVDNWCAPLATANAMVFLDQIARADWVNKITGGLSPEDLSAYPGAFMCTNGGGLCNTGGWAGTFVEYIYKGAVTFAEWDGRGLRCDLRKEAYPWAEWSGGVFRASEFGMERLWELYKDCFAKGIPVVLCFSFWNPKELVAIDTVWLSQKLGKGEIKVTFYEWGDPISSTEALRKEDPKIPEENGDAKQGIGHVVTGVGFIEGDPDGEGPLPASRWVIVHDNWSTTAVDVAIPWENVMALIVLPKC